MNSTKEDRGVRIALLALREGIARAEAHLQKMRATEALLVENLKDESLRIDRWNTPRAPNGSLQSAIVNALRQAKNPIGNSSIREAIKANGYPYQFRPRHLGKTITKLVIARKVIRVGRNRGAKYVLA